MPVQLHAGPGVYDGRIGLLPDVQQQIGNLRMWGYDVASPGASTIPTPRGCVALTEVGTHTARAQATTNRATRQGRVGYVSAASLAAMTEIYQASLPNVVRSQQFQCSYRIVPSDAAVVSGARAFYGVNASASAMTNVEINTLADVFGFGQMSTSNNLCLVTANSSGVGTVYDLGTNFSASSLTTDSYTMQFSWNMDGVGPIAWAIVNETTGWYAGGQEDKNLPTLNTYLYWHFWRCNNAQSIACAFDFGGLTCYDPY